MTKYEYMTKANFERIDDAWLNKYGEEGWELVQVIEVDTIKYYYFKRVKE